MKRLALIFTSFFIFAFTLALAPPALADKPSDCDSFQTFDQTTQKCITPIQNNTGTGTSVGGTGLGKIAPPQGFVKDVGTDPSGFVASLIRNGISLLIIASFVIAVIWTIINGLRFILANGDEKTISSAWTQIYWTLIGMVIILGSFAIIRLVETFFDVHILTGTFQLPIPKP